MKIEFIAAATLCTLGALAAPSWTWKEDSLSDKYFKADGRDLYFCHSGWEFVREDDKNYEFVLEKHMKRSHGADDGPHHDKNDDHGTCPDRRNPSPTSNVLWATASSALRLKISSQVLDAY